MNTEEAIAFGGRFAALSSHTVAILKRISDSSLCGNGWFKRTSKQQFQFSSSEQVFGIARMSLHPETVEALACLRSWYEAGLVGEVDVVKHYEDDVDHASASYVAYNRKYQTVTESVHAGVVFRCFVTHQKQSDEVSTGFADASTNLLITLTLNKFPT
ncbi:Uncharacterized protein APZ42_011891 [Daphnia magna]|uniref:Uncharacterized protein n=1 Tax=Daphnia magna TaxID=35525 RepID=A0A162SEH9_9CRUS|nr:Uncharacterized protein APZ42_011891 [Daphnia magna]